MIYIQGNQFKKNFKKLKKKYIHIGNDLKSFQDLHSRIWFLEEAERQNFFDNRNNTILYETPDKDFKIVKARMYSEDLKKKKFRVIYYIDTRLGKIILIELYSKNIKDSENERLWKECVNKYT